MAGGFWSDPFDWLFGRAGATPAAPPAPTVARARVDVDRALFQIIAGTQNPIDLTAAYGAQLVNFAGALPGGSTSAVFTIPEDYYGVGLNQLAPDQLVFIRYAGIGVFVGKVLERPITYESGADQQRIVAVNCVGIWDDLKRRDDFCWAGADYDYEQWYTAERDDNCPGINVQRTGSLRFIAPLMSYFTPWSATELWYWLHNGLDTAQAIHHVAFNWVNLGSMKWWLYETTLPSAAATWTLLGSGGGSDSLTRTSESFACSAGVRGLALKVGYESGKQLSMDEWLLISRLGVICQATEPTVGSALEAILTGTDLADSYYSATVT